MIDIVKKQIQEQHESRERKTESVSFSRSFQGLRYLKAEKQNFRSCPKAQYRVHQVFCSQLSG